MIDRLPASGRGMWRPTMGHPLGATGARKPAVLAAMVAMLVAVAFVTAILSVLGVFILPFSHGGDR